MMNEFPNVFELIGKLFDAAKAKCILIGGFAINSYGVTRQTADIDFLITDQDYKKLQPLFLEHGYRECHRQNLFAKLRSEEKVFMDIDFLFVDEETLLKILQRGKSVQISNHKFIIPSLVDLIALKLHSLKFQPTVREYPDMMDIVYLIRLNAIDVRQKEFKDLCLKFGTESLYDKILNGVFPHG